MPSRTVKSNQVDTHQNLQIVVRKHLNHVWQKPISNFSIESFGQIEQWLLTRGGPFILDSGCGTGESTFNLAQQFPDAKVLGFDRSEIRLRKLEHKKKLPENCLIVRAEAGDLWRQLVSSNIHPARHYLLYPNPYPKAAQLNQRWHGSPAFPYLVALGGSIELRSNWRIYVDEFSEAIRLATDQQPIVEHYTPDEALSLFERKYHTSGQPLWRLHIELSRLNHQN